MNNENEEIYNWRNEHGEIDFAYLESLKEEGTVEALEKLRSIAEDMSVDFNESTSVDELIDLITAEDQKNEDGNVDETS